MESPRGPGGGYTLGKPAAEITITDIITSVDEPMDATKCGGAQNCHGDGKPCMTHDLWTTLNDRIREYLDSVTLQSMMDEQMAKGIEIESRPMLRKAISSSPVIKPVKTNAPNSIFALGSVLNK